MLDIKCLRTDNIPPDVRPTNNGVSEVSVGNRSKNTNVARKATIVRSSITAILATFGFFGNECPSILQKLTSARHNENNDRPFSLIPAIN
jgi:hypothetical protein